ncbi:hypothetical protein CRENBAI_007828 [Crenichthys baileyi]|uniref:Uncharacterized protein n=1 Tax=Crenichthys baileyi TaxID=28760 RepID=A0AAV9SED2_9TELE
MFLPNLDLADKQKDDALDRWMERQKEEAMRNLPTDLEMLPSPLLLEQMEREAAQRQRVREGCSVPPPQLRRSPPASESPTCSSWSAGEEVVSLPADVKAAASKPASSSATALSSRLAASPPMPSPVALARCSEATPDELEQHLRFYAHTRALLLLGSPREVSRALLLGSPRQVSRVLLLGSPRQVYSLLQSFRRGPWVGYLHDQVLSTFLFSSGGCSWNLDLTHHSLTPGQTPQRLTPSLRGSGLRPQPLFKPLRVSVKPQPLLRALRVLEGSSGSASASEGSPGSEPVYEAPGSLAPACTLCQLGTTSWSPT